MPFFITLLSLVHFIQLLLGSLCVLTIWSLLLAEFQPIGVFQPFTWTCWIYLPSFMVARLFFDFIIFTVSIGQIWVIPLFEFLLLRVLQPLVMDLLVICTGCFFAFQFLVYVTPAPFRSTVSIDQSGASSCLISGILGFFQPFTRTCWVYLPSFIVAREFSINIYGVIYLRGAMRRVYQG